MTTILRLASYPTLEESGRGLHCYEISKTDKTKVIYLTWFKTKCSPLKIPKNVTLYVRKFYTIANPKKSNFINRFIFNMYRIFRVFTFSINGIYILFKHKVDVVHIHSPMFIIVSIFGYFLRKKNYITFHGEDFFNIKNAWWYSKLSSCFDCVFSISPRYIAKLKKIHTNADIIQIYNGIDTNIYKNLKLNRSKQILAVANFKKQKGLDTLIKGFNQLIKSNVNSNNYKLVIAGKGILFEEITRMIKSMKLEEKVFLVGQKNRLEIIDLYNRSEIFILSSIWEGFAKVLVEAMACGCKVISTRVDSAPLVLEDWGYMINHSDQNEVCTSLQKIINDKCYPFNSQEKVLKKFTWNNVRNIYQKTIENNKSGSFEL
ncbi:glycosyltransferase family 4 protein [Candidatus Marinimicrobia bacterium]|nr:glycosyltransferase family 4 protein [Candidatus Neomarinimicrobiota bacterium]